MEGIDQRVSSAVVGLRKHYRDDNSSLVLVLPYPTAEDLHNQEAFHDYYTEVETCHAAVKHIPNQPFKFAIAKWWTEPIL